MMEVGDRGLQNLGSNRKADNVFNPEIRGLFPPLAVSGNGNVLAPSNSAVADITMANTSSGVGSDTNRAPLTTDTGTVASIVSTICTEVDRLQAATLISSLGDSQSSQADFDFPNLAGETQQVVDDQAEFDYMHLAGETQPADDQEGFDDMVLLQNDVVTATSVQPTNGGFGAPYERFQDSNAQLQESLGGGPPPHIPATASNNIGIAGMRASSRDGADALNKVIGTEDPDAPPLEPASVAAAAEGPSEMVIVEEVHTMVEPPAAQIHGVEPSMVKEPVLGGFKAEEMTPLKDDWGTYEAEPKNQGETTAEAKLFTSTEVPSVAIMANELPSENASVQLEGADVNNDVSEQDVQAIKGRQVLKKFGRKRYQGDVVDYNSENKWFKVVYEDGDEEDLEFLEVKEILLPLGSSPKTSSAKKRPHPEGGADKKERNPKKHKDEKIETPKKKGRASRKGKGASSGKKRSVQTKKSSKKPEQAKSPGSKPKSLRKSTTTTKPTSEAGNTKSLQAQKKTDLETKPEENLDASDINSPMQSQARGGKRKRNSGTEASTGSNPRKKISKAKTPSKSPVKKKTGKTKTPRKSSAKKITGKAQTPAKSSSKKKGTRRRRSLSKLPGEGRESEKTLSKSRVRGSTMVEEIEERKSKRLKTDASKQHDVFVGKPIKKDFGGTLYNGVVVKFDKKSKYYKVKYEDGDQEDLELEELEAILVMSERRTK